MSIFALFKKKKPKTQESGNREKVLAQVEELRLHGAKSQAMAVLEVAYRNKEISAFDYENAKTNLLREFD